MYTYSKSGFFPSEGVLAETSGGIVDLNTSASSRRWRSPQFRLLFVWTKAEIVDSANFLVSLLAEVDAIARALTGEQLQSMAISVANSCLSAGLSFAGRDKSDGIVLSLPGKVGWGPTMGCLVLR